jgi:hypothetical protein
LDHFAGHVFVKISSTLAAASSNGVTAHGSPSGPLQFDRLGSYPGRQICYVTSVQTIPGLGSSFGTPIGVDSGTAPARGQIGFRIHELPTADLHTSLLKWKSRPNVAASDSTIPRQNTATP